MFDQTCCEVAMARDQAIKFLRSCCQLSRVEFATDGSITVKGNVVIQQMLPGGNSPVVFDHVGGSFTCSGTGLTSLIRVPRFIGGDFNISNNPLASLHDGPTTVHGLYDCFKCQLTSFEGTPNSVYALMAKGNQLTSLKHCPISMTGINVSNNPLTSLDGLPTGFDGVLTLSWSENLPILSLLRLRQAPLFVGRSEQIHQITVILEKYKGDASRANIIACQKELIVAGFVGNASW